MQEIILNTPYAKDQWKGPHPFPVVDFKFRNTGNGTAFLTKFNVEILETRVDVAPELQFRWDLTEESAPSAVRSFWQRRRPVPVNSLSVSAANVGWGPALNFDLTFQNDLCRLFRRVVSVKNNIQDDNFVTVRTLLIEDLDKGPFLEAAKQCASDWHYRLKQPQDERPMFHRRWRVTPDILKILSKKIPFVTVDDIRFNWNCSASDGSIYNDSETLSIGNREIGSFLLITQESFTFVEGERFGQNICGAAMPPGPTFCALIDPEEGRISREYPISRRIDAGDVERFQILIGASKSCFLEVRISFDIDGQKQQAASGVFALHIENRRDQRHHFLYRDGQEILAEVTEAQEQEARRDARRFRRFAD